jgi:hypothetical protein
MESDEPLCYRETIAVAVREFAANNLSESRSLFARAHERLLAHANNFVARARLDAKPSLASWWWTACRWRLCPGESLPLQVGDHTLELKAPGFAPEKRRLSAKGGAERTLTVVLAQSPIAGASASISKRRWYTGPWLWGSGGVLVVAGGRGLCADPAGEDDDSVVVVCWPRSEMTVSHAPQ